MRVALLAAGAAFVAAAGSAGASWAQPSLTDRLYACTGMTDSQARLACFDAAVAELKQAQTAGEVSVVSRAEVQQAEKDTFGLDPAAQAKAMTAVAPATAPPELDVVKVTIASAEKRANGTFRFTLDNGQVWDQIDTGGPRSLPRGAIEGEIRRAALGSFLLKPGNRAAVRVKRVK